jgi:hypothetical protein
MSFNQHPHTLKRIQYVWNNNLQNGLLGFQQTDFYRSKALKLLHWTSPNTVANCQNSIARCMKSTKPFEGESWPRPFPTRLELRPCLEKVAIHWHHLSGSGYLASSISRIIVFVQFSVADKGFRGVEAHVVAAGDHGKGARALHYPKSEEYVRTKGE